MIEWWESHENIILLAAWMLEEEYAASEIIYMFEKPWKYTEEFVRAVSENGEEIEDN